MNVMKFLLVQIYHLAESKMTAYGKQRDIDDFKQDPIAVKEWVV
ncbi:MAG: hypothetical protein NVS9B14_02630 [Candidatus Acidiferrum sp.]